MIPVAINYEVEGKQFNKVINVFEFNDLDLFIQRMKMEIVWIKTREFNDAGIPHKVEYSDNPSSFDIEASQFYNDLKGDFHTNEEVANHLKKIFDQQYKKYIEKLTQEYLSTNNKKKEDLIEEEFKELDRKANLYAEADKAKEKDFFQQRACMYLWQYAFGIKDTVIIGRTWGEFFILLKTIKETFNLWENKRLIIYVFNLSYEGRWLKDWFTWDLEKWGCLFSNKIYYYLKPVSLKWIDGTDISFKGFLFRDAYVLAGVKEAKLNGLMEHYKDKAHKLVGKLDYDKVRHSQTKLTNDEIAYAIYDVIVCNWFIQLKKEKYGRVIDIPMTKTEETKRRLKDKVYYTNPNIKSKKDHKYINYRKYLNNLRPDFNIYQRIRFEYAGGLTRASYKKARRIWSADEGHGVMSMDLSSSYGAVICSKKFPVTAYQLVKVDTLEKFYYYIMNKACLFDIHFHNIRPKYNDELDLNMDDVDNIISISKTEILGRYNENCQTKHIAGVDPKHPYDSPLFNNNGRVRQAMDLYLVLNEIDFANINDFYDFDWFDVDNFYIAEKDYLPKDIIQYVVDLFQKKTSYKYYDEMKLTDTDEYLQYIISKTDISSIYGCMSQDPLKMSYTYNKKDGYSVLQSEEKLYEDNPDAYNDLLKEKLNQKLDSDSYFLAYNWSHVLTAWARRNLITAIKRAGDKFIYCDTDSMYAFMCDDLIKFVDEYNADIDRQMNECFKARGIKQDSHKAYYINKKGVQVWKGLGYFEIENKCNIDENGQKTYIPYKRFVTCGAKRYLKEYYEPYDNQGHTLLMTVAGLNKKSVDYLESVYGRDGLFQAFADGNLYCDEINTGKLAATYIDFPTSGKVIDYEENETTFFEMSSVHLEKMDFNMHLTETYEKLTFEGRIWEPC